MDLSYNLNINQSQKLILTKELRQSLEILNMNSFELEDVIKKEHEENPVIDIDKKAEIDWEKFLNHLGSDKFKLKQAVRNEEEELNIENIVKSDMTLIEHLKNQVSCMKINKSEKLIVNYLIDSIDDDGYLRTSMEDLLEDIPACEEDILKALCLVQSLEPSGVGARNIKECLLIQIHERCIDDEVLIQIVDKDLELLANKKYKDLSKKHKIKIEDCIMRHEIIKTLDPKPGSKFSKMKNQYIIPDIIVEKIGDDFVLRLNDANIPNIKVNSMYEEILKSCKDDIQAKEYIKEKLNSAVNLIKSVENRKNTIVKIGEMIVSQQKDFFVKGKKHLKPMIMSDIAIKIGCHESTISRAVNGKYMLTPFGVQELRYFFSSGLKDCEEIATTSIKTILKEIINSENKFKPYSDEKICTILKEKDINISRRTVAKYREELGIEGSSKRKKY